MEREFPPQVEQSYSRHHPSHAYGLREHLYRVHVIDTHDCLRCKTQFTTKRDLEKHHKEKKDCPVNRSKSIQGVTPEVLDIIKDHKFAYRNKGNPVGQWMDIWRELFPYDEPPESPYIRSAPSISVPDPDPTSAEFPITAGVNYSAASYAPSSDQDHPDDVQFEPGNLNEQYRDGGWTYEGQSQSHAGDAVQDYTAESEYGDYEQSLQLQQSYAPLSASNTSLVRDDSKYPEDFDDHLVDPELFNSTF